MPPGWSAAKADITGRSYHQLDGRWGRSRTFFDSALYKELLAVIEYALGHADAAYSVTEDGIDLEGFCREAGLSDAQWEAIAMSVEGFSARQIAGFLEISHQAVSRRLKRARQTLDEARLKIEVAAFV